MANTRCHSLFGWCARLAVAVGLSETGAGPARAVDVACVEHARESADEAPDALRLIDVDCARQSKTTTTGPFTDKDSRSQYMHGVHALQAQAGLNLTGRGVTVGIWDAGHVLPDHAELAGRVTIGDPKKRIPWGDVTIPVPLHEHATHVAGAIAARGRPKREAQGMAPEANIVSFYWNEDVSDMRQAAGRGISVTNHSYGAPAGWEYTNSSKCAENWTWLGRDTETMDARFGAYDAIARNFDDVVWQSRSLSVFVAAGNERGTTSDPTKVPANIGPKFNGSYCIFENQAWSTSTKKRESDTSKGGFDTMTGRALAKNVITIGAAVALNPQFDPSRIEPTYLSSMGPTDDGRIKPDLLANGDGVFSTYLPDRCRRDRRAICWPEDRLAGGDLERYLADGGTSMATPVAAGIGALLNELAQRVRGRILFADEMKAALIHTAISPTRDGAPSYGSGWGLIDAARAAYLLKGNAGTLMRRGYEAAASQFEAKLTWKDRSEPLTITMVWIDEPGAVENPLVLDDRTSKLVDKLDVQLMSPSNKPYFPWSLDVNEPAAKASRRGSNRVDNVQRIDVESTHWEEGIWRLVARRIEPKSRALDVAIAVGEAATLQ